MRCDGAARHGSASARSLRGRGTGGDAAARAGSRCAASQRNADRPSPGASLDGLAPGCGRSREGVGAGIEPASLVSRTSARPLSVPNDVPDSNRRQTDQKPWNLNPSLYPTELTSCEGPRFGTRHTPRQRRAHRTGIATPYRWMSESNRSHRHDPSYCRLSPAGNACAPALARVRPCAFDTFPAPSIAAQRHRTAAATPLRAADCVSPSGVDPRRRDARPRFDARTFAADAAECVAAFACGRAGTRGKRLRETVRDTAGRARS